MGGFAHDTGEGQSRAITARWAAILIRELGSGYFWLSHGGRQFDPVRFAEQAQDPQVNGGSCLLSQGAKPATAACCRARR